jgi:site-specific recombinase
MYSLCWFYGGIAGMYLFLSGIVTGYFDNEVVYSKIPERIREHPFLKSVLSTKRLQKLANYLNHNLGSIMGNIMIGIFLGTAAFIGKTFGLPFDIRHVTFSMGLLAVSLQSTFFHIDFSTLCWIFLGIVSIGFFNIIVSFGLAFYVALKSRNIDSAQLIQLPKLMFIYFKKHPMDFFYPPGAERTEEDVFPEKTA